MPCSQQEGSRPKYLSAAEATVFFYLTSSLKRLRYKCQAGQAKEIAPLFMRRRCLLQLIEPLENTRQGCRESD